MLNVTSAGDNARYSPASPHSACVMWQPTKCSSLLVTAASTFLAREEKEDLRCRSMGEDSGKWPSHLQNPPWTTQTSNTLQCSHGFWAPGQFRELQRPHLCLRNYICPSSFHQGLTSLKGQQKPQGSSLEPVAWGDIKEQILCPGDGDTPWSTSRCQPHQSVASIFQVSAGHPIELVAHTCW